LPTNQDRTFDAIKDIAFNQFAFCLYQSLRHHTPLNGCNPCQKLDGPQWLGAIVISTRIEHPGDLVFLMDGGQEDHWRIEFGVLAQVPKHLESIGTRHIPVQYEQIKGILEKTAKDAVSIGEHNNRVPCLGQHKRNFLSQCGLVFEQSNVHDFLNKFNYYKHIISGFLKY